MKSKSFLLVLIVVIFNACNKHRDLAEDNGPFTADLLLNRNELLSQGYELTENKLSIIKDYKAHIVTYEYLPSTDILYTKYIVYRNLYIDSLQLMTWIEDNDGIVLSPWIQCSQNIRKLFVRSRTNALVFTLYLKDDNVIIYFHFPDVGKDKRSEKREFTIDGRVIIKDSQNGQLIEMKSQPCLDW